jgi:glycosyltransferase involved in cell wall biosynthesis
MHIALDARAWNWTGVGRYIRSLAKEYLQNSGGHNFTLLVPINQEEKIQEELGDKNNIFEYVGVEPSYYSLKEQTVFLQQLNNLKNIDLVHFAHFNVPLLYKKPYVVTIHDVTRFIFPGQKRQSLLQQIGYEYVFAHAVRNAKIVIAVSKTTAQDMSLLPFRSQYIEVITEGIEDKFFETIAQDQINKLREYLNFKNPYILFVGVWMSHKNIFRLLDAFEIVSKKYPDTKLVITGKYEQGYSNLVGYVQSKNLENSVIFPGFVADELLPALYAEAELMIFPSLYEGYGLPPLEAQACGTAVVSSNVSSMPELLKSTVEYVSPEHVHDIARGIIRVLDDFKYASELRQRGMQNAEQYRTKLTAEEHIRAYENALQ